ATAAGFSAIGWIRRLSAEVNGRDPWALVPELAADRLASRRILDALRRRERLRGRAARSRRLPAGQCFVACLRVTMAEAVHMTEARRLARPVVSLAMLNVGLLRRDGRAAACQAVRGVERRPLFRRGDRHRSGAPALGPRALEHDAIAAIGVAGLELDGFFAPQPERVLQFKAHTHLRIKDA